MDQALKKQVKKYAVMTVIMVIMALAVVKLNNVDTAGQPHRADF